MHPRSIDTDERPFVLIWEVTQACELACRHCRADARPGRHPDELDTEEGKSLLEEARSFGDGQLVVLSGGDPLARDDISELVEYGSEIGLRMTMTPSGTASLTGDRVESLSAAGLKRMALSLDGASPETHDAFRMEAGSFEQTIDAAEYARAAGLPLQINTTVCAETLSELPAIAELVDELGAVLWSVFFLVPVGRGQLLAPIDPETAEEVMQWLGEINADADFGVKTTEAPHYRRVMMQTAAADAADSPGKGAPDHGAGKANESARPDGIGRRTGITAGDGFAFVSHTGEVYPSGFLPKSAGSVREASIVDIYRESELFTSLRQKDELRGKCGACEFRHVCGGSRSRAYAYTGDPMESDPLCGYVPDGYDGPLPEQASTP